MRFLFRAFVAAALLMAGAVTGDALVLDWSTANWAPGTTSNSFDVDGDGLTDVTVTFSGQLNVFTTQNSDGTGSMTPVVDTVMSGGQSPVKPSLDIAGNLHTNSNLTMTVTFSPRFTLGTGNVSFTIFDIDQQTNDDQIANIYAYGLGASVPTAATITNIGSAITPSGTGLSQMLDGSVSSPNTGVGSGNGNATIGWGTTPISNFQFTFQNTAGAPRFQQIAISNSTFSPVPEINPAGVAIGGCTCAAVLYFRRRKLVSKI